MKITHTTTLILATIVCKCSSFIPTTFFKPNMIFKSYDNMNCSINRKNFMANSVTVVGTLTAATKASNAETTNDDDNEESDDTTKYTGEGFYIERENNNVYLYGEINANSCIMLRKSLSEAQKLCKNLSLKYKIEALPINLHIQTMGGSLMPTFPLLDFIQNSEIPIHSYVEGFSASCGSIIAVVCKKRYITKKSFILMHQLSASSGGKYNAMQQEMSNLKSFMTIIKNVYLENTKIKEDEIDEILTGDIWFNAEKCLELGLVDEIN